MPPGRPACGAATNPARSRIADALGVGSHDGARASTPAPNPSGRSAPGLDERRPRATDGGELEVVGRLEESEVDREAEREQAIDPVRRGAAPKSACPRARRNTADRASRRSARRPASRPARPRRAPAPGSCRCSSTSKALTTSNDASANGSRSARPRSTRPPAARRLDARAGQRVGTDIDPDARRIPRRWPPQRGSHTRTRDRASAHRAAPGGEMRHPVLPARVLALVSGRRDSRC